MCAIRKAAALTGAVIVSMAVFAAPAHGAEGVTAALSDVKNASQGVRGVLTIRSTDPLEVDPASLVATIDGEDAPVSIQKATRVERRAMLVIDTSGSMGTSGMATVRSATAAYLRIVPQDAQIGVASFANTAGVDLAPTKDRAAVQRVVNGFAARGDTSLYAGMLGAIQALGSQGDRSIVLLSDGADTVAKDESGARAQVTTALKRAGIRVDVVRFNTNDPDATSALSAIAAASGGSVVAASNSRGVTTAFQTSARALDSQSEFVMMTQVRLAGTHTIGLRGRAGTTNFKVEQVVSFGAQPPSPAAPAAQPKTGALQTSAAIPGATGSWWPYVAAGLVGGAAVLLAAGMLVPATSRRQQRVESIERYVIPVRVRSRSEHKEQATPLTDQIMSLGDRVMKDRASTTKTVALIDRADLPLRAGEWFIVRVVSVIVGVLLFYVVLRPVPLIGMAVGLLAGVLAPPAVLRFLASRRAKAFERLLPDILMLVATSLRSGFGLPQALDAVARDAAEPAAKEFSRALAETRIGTDVTESLDHMSARMDSQSMQWTVMAIRVQREVGGNLAETLTTTATTLREREALQRQVRTLSAEGRLSAMILIALPIFVFFYMLLVNFAYISLLWTTLFGAIMSTIGVVLMVVGVFWMRRVVRIEV